jgi:glyoxylate reductase
MARVFATCDIGSDALALLREAGHEVEVHQDPAGPSHALLVERAGSGVIALISCLRDPIDRAVLEAGRGSLRVVAQDSVGTDNIDLQAATELGVVVTNTPGVLTEATAEFALFLMGAVARRLPESEALVREGTWAAWHPQLPILGTEVSGASVAVVGCGRIGRSFALKCAGLDMDLLLVSGRRDEAWLGAVRAVQAARVAAGAPRRASAEYLTLEQALPRADFVSLHVPLVAGGERSTAGLIGRRELGLMRPGAYLINTARGPVVDEDALVDALRSRRIAGAGLDVFVREPLPADSPLLGEELKDRVRVAHHFGSGTTKTRLSPDPEEGMAGRTVAALLDALSDGPDYRWALNAPRS